MDILAQRKSVGTLTGQLLVGGRPVGRGFIRKTAYVPQEDNFVPVSKSDASNMALTWMCVCVCARVHVGLWDDGGRLCARARARACV
jgi:hypothetical protein